MGVSGLRLKKRENAKIFPFLILTFIIVFTSTMLVSQILIRLGLTLMPEFCYNFPKALLIDGKF